MNIINKTIVSFYLIGAILMSFYWGSRGINNTLESNVAIAEVASALASIVFVLAPFIVQKIFKMDFSQILLSTYFLFLFFSHFVGSVLNTYDRNIMYDDYVHTAFGSVGTLMGIYLFSILEDVDTKKPLTVIFFGFMFALACGGMWEIYEYFADSVLGLNMQRQEVGYLPTSDTIHDLYVTYIGGTVVAVLYLLNYKIPKYSFIVGHYINRG